MAPDLYTQHADPAQRYPSMSGNVTLADNTAYQPYDAIATSTSYALYSNPAYSRSIPSSHHWPQGSVPTQYNEIPMDYYPSANMVPASEYHTAVPGSVHASHFQPAYDGQTNHAMPFVPPAGTAEYAPQTMAATQPIWYAHQYAPGTDENNQYPG
jgi:hypothetical protein